MFYFVNLLGYWVLCRFLYRLQGYPMTTLDASPREGAEHPCEHFRTFISLLSRRIIIFFIGYSSYDSLSNKQHDGYIHVQCFSLGRSIKHWILLRISCSSTSQFYLFIHNNCTMRLAWFLWCFRFYQVVNFPVLDGRIDCLKCCSYNLTACSRL